VPCAPAMFVLQVEHSDRGRPDLLAGLSVELLDNPATANLLQLQELFYQICVIKAVSMCHFFWGT
jgi:hypothetical protein